MSALERHLAGRDFLLDGFTVADAYLVTVLNWAQYCGVALAEWPAVRRMQARPSVARAFSEEMALYEEEQARRNAA